MEGIEQQQNNIAEWGHVMSHLRYASQHCAQRGLLYAAKWAGEMIVSLGVGQTERLDELTAVSHPQNTLKNLPGQQHEKDVLNMIQAALNLREYDRVIQLVKRFEGSSPQKNDETITAFAKHLLFLRLYAFYMIGEKRAVNFEDTADGTLSSRIQIANQNLPVIHAQLKAFFNSHTRKVPARHSSSISDTWAKELLDRSSSNMTMDDAFLLYLLGVVCSKLNQKATASILFIASVRVYPWNWSAWHELSNVISSHKDLQSSIKILNGIPELDNAHFMRRCFQIFIGVALYLPLDQVVPLFESIKNQLPENSWLQGIQASFYYHHRDYETAISILRDVEDRDSMCLDYIDIYSNILYVKGEERELSLLARKASQIDPYLPECCVAIGNYYSIKSDHKIAVTYFKRAIQLSPSYLPAYTLLGHEFMEMKNAGAAISAYRSALQIDEREYRAWFGLGQAYEMSHIEGYGVFYYNRAVSLRPYDPRMWSALAQAYESLGNLNDAIKCLQRALLSPECDSGALAKLAKLYTSHEEQGDKAITYYQLFWEETVAIHSPDGEEVDDEDGGTSSDFIEACLYLARKFRDQNNLSKAQVYLNPISHTMEGRALSREFSSSLGRF